MRQALDCKLTVSHGQGFSLLLLGNDGPIRSRADVAANELQLGVIGSPHKVFVTIP